MFLKVRIAKDINGYRLYVLLEKMREDALEVFKLNKLRTQTSV